MNVQVWIQLSGHGQSKAVSRMELAGRGGQPGQQGGGRPPHTRPETALVHTTVNKKSMCDTLPVLLLKDGQNRENHDSQSYKNPRGVKDFAQGGNQAGVRKLRENLKDTHTEEKY